MSTSMGTYQYDGIGWQTFGTPVSGIARLGLLPNGAVLRSTSNEVTSSAGGTWQPYATIDGTTTAIAASAQGDVFLAGTFVHVDGQLSQRYAHARPNCPAAALPFGAGCSGSAGPMTLQAIQLPWLGGAATGTANGFATPSIGLLAIGTVMPSIPLPLGAPGCALHTDPVSFDVLSPSAGSAPFAIAIPNTPGLAGLFFRVQGIALELGGGGAIAQTASSNALQLVLGTL